MTQMSGRYLSLEEVANRVNEGIDHLDGGRQALLDLGVPASTLSRLLHHQGFPNVENLVTVAEGLGWSVDYLLFGEGSGKTGCPTSKQGDLEGIFGKGARQVLEESPQGVPARYFCHPDWLTEILGGGDPADGLLVLVRTDAMASYLSPGDQIIVNLADNDLIPREGVYLLGWQGVYILRRLQMTTQGLRVSADNLAYESEVVTPTQFRRHFAVGGRVVWVGRSV